ncbi:hypothetical protein Noda2021_11100 [Candidatus Dependentiae bacterium Noda2021]|nr:hypothetical protein Noda2021_11100 [Candidatus Dependentiae bacterium Noda2021]
MTKRLSIYILLGVMCLHNQSLVHAQDAMQEEMTDKGCCKPRPSCCNPCFTAPRPCYTNNCCRDGQGEMEMAQEEMTDKGCCKPRPSCCNPCSTAPRPCYTNSCCREGQGDMETAQEEMTDKGCCKPRPSCCNPCFTAPRPCYTNNCCREGQGDMEMAQEEMVDKGCCKPRPSCCNPCFTAPRPCYTNSCCRDYDMMEVNEVNPAIMCEMRYASDNNCMKQAMCGDKCFVRTEVAMALDAVQKELEMMGLCLKVWDAYRPMSMQQKLWKACPNECYMVNPAHADYHSCGLAVNVTMVDLMTGEDCEMPSDFNEFSARAHCDSTDCSMMAQRNRHILHDVMTKHGFKGYDQEWHNFYFEKCTDCTPMDVELA